MFLIREQILKMKEAQLQEKVLIPLFISMGYRDVQPHGGNTEFGKDIVMWKEVEFGRRWNVAVVAKAKQVSGSVSGNSGAHTVAAQIRQCFGKNYLDSLSSEGQRINHVFVVSSKRIPPTAIEAIKSLIDDSIVDRSVTYINGDRLWEHIEQYMGEKTIFHKLAQIKKYFDEADPHYRIISSMQGNTISLSLQPKEPNAIKDHPLRISGRFRFPDTPEGRAKREEYEQHLKTGSTVVIPKEYVEEFNAPELFGQMLDPIKESDFEITTGSLPDPTKVVIVRIIMECNDGEKAVLDYVPLLKVQGGTEEVTLTNQGQKVPWKFTVVIHLKEKHCTIQINLEYDGVNVKRTLEGARFLNAISKGGFLRIEHWESGFSMWSQPVEPGAMEQPSPEWIDLLQKILLIQEKLRVPFAVTASISFQEAQAIYETAHKLQFGRIEPSDITLRIESEGARDILTWFESGKPYFSRLLRDDEVVEILGTQVHLGPVKVDILNGYLPQETLTSLRQTLESAAPADFISICFEASEERPIIVEYANWLATEQAGEKNSPAAEEQGK